MYNSCFRAFLSRMLKMLKAKFNHQHTKISTTLKFLNAKNFDTVVVILNYFFLIPMVSISLLSSLSSLTSLFSLSRGFCFSLFHNLSSSFQGWTSMDNLHKHATTHHHLHYGNLKAELSLLSSSFYFYFYFLLFIWVWLLRFENKGL